VTHTCNQNKIAGGVQVGLQDSPGDYRVKHSHECTYPEQSRNGSTTEPAQTEIDNTRLSSLIQYRAHSKDDEFRLTSITSQLLGYHFEVRNG